MLPPFVKQRIKKRWSKFQNYEDKSGTRPPFQPPALRQTTGLMCI